MRAADLHTHTARSDGLLSPTELLQLAADTRLDCLALTDHDSVAGLPEASAAAARLGVELIAGVELSVRDAEGNDDHLLGLFIDPAAPALQAYLEQLQAGRRGMAQLTLEALARLGLPLHAERVAELARGAVVTRPHIARAMVEAGYVATEQEAFDRYLGAGKPAAPERPTPDHATAIRIIRQAGGVASLAHPIFPRDPGAADRLAALPARLAHLRDQGLTGVECLYPDAPTALRQQLLSLTTQAHLIPTGGSDYHGPGKAPHAPLGQVTTPPETLTHLQSQRPH